MDPMKPWPIIIGGCHRSGTSLIRRVLNSHSRIHCGPEVKFFRDFYGDYFEDPLRHLRFATSAQAILPEADLLEILGRAFVAVHERAAERAGKPRWADKNPENVLYLDQWQRLLRDRWVFVHMVRNPLDTIASIAEVRFPLSVPADLDGRIDLYLRYTRAGLDFAAAHPDRCLRIVYERLAAEPRAGLEALMRWLGEAFEERQMAFNHATHESGLEDPKVGETSAIHGDSVDRWRSKLSLEEARRIWNRARAVWSEVDSEGAYFSGRVVE